MKLIERIDYHEGENVKIANFISYGGVYISTNPTKNAGRMINIRIFNLLFRYKMRKYLKGSNFRSIDIATLKNGEPNKWLMYYWVGYKQFFNIFTQGMSYGSKKILDDFMNK